jgi:hypothetical protein
MSVITDKIKEIVTIRLDKMKTVEGSKGVIILYHGRQLIMDSGKRIWSQRRHASCALSNHLTANYEICKEAGNMSITTGKVIKQLEKEGIIEFKELK